MNKSKMFFVILLLAVTLIAYFIPYYDWDLVAYVGSAIALQEHDSKLIQQQAYAVLRAELPEDDYADLTNGSDFRHDVAQNAEHFRQQLRFYKIRPLYVWTVAALHRIGIGYVPATRIISATAFFFIGILVQAWLRRYIGELQAAVCAILLLLAPVLFASARTGSPDALSAFVVLLGVYISIERDAPLIASALMLLSLALRTDNVLFVLIFLGVEIFRATTKRTRVTAAVAMLAAVVIVLTINHVEHSYPWSVLMQNTAMPITDPAEVSPKISASDYFGAVHDMVDEAGESSVAVFPFIAVIALLSSRTPDRLKNVVKIVLFSWAAHIIVFPHIEDRYFIFGAAIIGVAAAAGLRKSSSASVPFAVANG